MIGGARTFHYYVELDRFKLNLAGQELKEKKFDDYQRICNDLEDSSLSGAVLNFYDVSTKRKNSDKIKVLESKGNKKSPDKLVDIVDELWGGISHPTTTFLIPDHQELNGNLLDYENVRKELAHQDMKYISRNVGLCGLKLPISALATGLGLLSSFPGGVIISGARFSTSFSPSVGIPLAIAGGLVLYDSIREYMAHSRHDQKENFIHEKEFRKLLHCARQTDKYMTQKINLKCPGKPLPLTIGEDGGVGEPEKEAIRIAKKLKRKI